MLLPHPPLSMLARKVFPALLALFPLAAFAAGNVTLTLSPRLPESTTLASSGDDRAFVLVSALGETVTLTLTEGREYVLRTQSELLGTQFEEVPSRGEYVRLTPEADADSGGYVVRVEAARLLNGRLRHFTSTVAAQPGKWVRLWGADDVSSRRTIRWGNARTVRDDVLYLKVEQDAASEEAQPPR